MTCRVNECAKECGLKEYEWWRAVQQNFVAAMIGRYLWDGLGEPPTAEGVIRSLKVWYAATRAHKVKDITAMIDMVDRARRKHADSVRNEEG